MKSSMHLSREQNVAHAAPARTAPDVPEISIFTERNRLSNKITKDFFEGRVAFSALIDEIIKSVTARKLTVIHANELAIYMTTPDLSPDNLRSDHKKALSSMEETSLSRIRHLFRLMLSGPCSRSPEVVTPPIIATFAAGAGIGTGTGAAYAAAGAGVGVGIVD